jgi:selenocysteine lyase/cysteine desulfurase
MSISMCVQALTKYAALPELESYTVKKSGWKNLPPYQGGGEMIAEVTFEKTTYADLPHKFEAGTPNIAGGIAFGVAIDL